MDAARFNTRPNPAVELGVRPRHTSPSDGGILLRVRAVAQLSTEIVVYGAVDEAEEFAMQVAGQVNIQSGTVQHVAIDASSARLFDLDTGLSCAR
jgi:ABC-type sugar transport system ATPase subunit